MGLLCVGFLCMMVGLFVVFMVVGYFVGLVYFGFNSWFIMFFSLDVLFVYYYLQLFWCLF